MMTYNMEGRSMTGQGKMSEKCSARSEQVHVERKGKYVSHPNPGQIPQGCQEGALIQSSRKPRVGSHLVVGVAVRR